MASEIRTQLERFIRNRPGSFLVGIVVVYLTLDLLAKLLFFELQVGASTLLGGSLTFSQLSGWLWQGTTIGLAYGLAAVGLSMTYSILEFPNFSHGELFTTGGFVGWSVTFLIAGLGQFDIGHLALLTAGDVNPSALGVNALATPIAIVLGVVLAAMVTIGVALIIDRLAYEPIREQGTISLLLASIGVALILRYVLNIIYGGSRIGLTTDVSKYSLGAIDGHLVLAKGSSVFRQAQTGTDPAADAIYVRSPVGVGQYTAELIGATTHEVVLVIVALSLMYGLHVLLQRTKLGTAMRAMADNKALAQVTGIPTERVIRNTWVISAGLVGVAGYVFSLKSGTIFFRQGWEILLLVFAAVIVGGIGSIYGAMVGGFVIGVVSNVSLVWIPSSLTAASAFAIMILVLLFKSEGLFGGVITT